MRSRYYDPQVGRFLNMDNIGVLPFESLMPHGANLFMYCYNNPVMFSDPSGNGPTIGFIIAAIILGAVGFGTYRGVRSHQQGNRGFDLVGDIILGAAIGAVAGLAFALNPSGFVFGAIIGGVFGGLGAWMQGEDWVHGIIEGAIWGGIAGGFAGAFGRIARESQAFQRFAVTPTMARNLRYVGQMGISMGTYAGRHATSGTVPTVRGLFFSALGGALGASTRFTAGEAIFVAFHISLTDFVFRFHGLV